MIRALRFAALLSACIVGFNSCSLAEDEHATSDEQTEHGHVDAGAETAAGAETDGHDHGTDATHSVDADHAHEGAHDAHGSAHESHGNTHPLSIDPDLLIFTLLAFGLTYFVMSKFAWKPIQAALDKRDSYVAAQLAEAQRQDEESERLRKEHADQLSGASDEVRSLLDQARKEAEQEKQSILDAAQAAAAAEKQQAIAAIGAARGDALQELAGKSVDTAVQLAGKIVGRPLKKDDHAGLIDDAVKQFTSSSDA